MTLILKLDLHIIKMYHPTKNEVSMSIGSKVIAQTGKHTDRHTHTHTHTYTQDENIISTAYAGGKKNNFILVNIHYLAMVLRAEGIFGIV